MHRSRQAGGEAELLVAYRFITAGRFPSLPLIPMSYDLIVDCGDCLQRVQVKLARWIEGTAWTVKLTKRRGKQDFPQEVATADYVCIVCDPNQVYVVPSVVLRSPNQPEMFCTRIELYEDSERFQPYRNAFALGQGFTGTRQAEVQELRQSWYPDQQKATIGRKRHVRLSVEIINVIRQRLGPDPTRKAVLDVAAEYGITEVTLRAHLKGKRRDLR